MITVQDRIELAGTDVARLRALLDQQYIGPAGERGLRFLDFQASPPLVLRNQPTTAWVRWQVQDIGAWWGMRAVSSSPAVLAFWREVDSFCYSRQRHYLAAPEAFALSRPEDTGAYQVATRRHRETAQLALRPELAADEREHFARKLQRATESLPGLETASLGANLAPEYAAGHFTWDLLYPSRDAARTATASPAWTTSVEPLLAEYCRAWDALELETIGAGLRQHGLRDGIKRTAFFRLLPGVEPAVAQRFEADLLEMPAQIPEILNWRLSRARALPWQHSENPPWTWVWEQEFAALDGLTGPYMAHPHHWAHIDRWFDPESGSQIVDLHLSHAFSPLSESLITREAAGRARQA